MSNWNQYVVTDKGRTLLAETGIKDNALTFLHMKTSSHVYTKDQLAGLTSLEDVQGTFPFTAKETVNNTSVKLECIVSNKDVATAYTWNTIGIYAADSTGAETLYAVSTAIDPVQMKPIKDGNLNQFTLTIYLQVGNAEKVEIQVQMDAYVSLQVFESFQTTVTKQLATLEQAVPGGPDHSGLWGYGSKYAVSLDDLGQGGRRQRPDHRRGYLQSRGPGGSQQ